LEKKKNKYANRFIFSNKNGSIFLIKTNFWQKNYFIHDAKRMISFHESLFQKYKKIAYFHIFFCIFLDFLL